MTSQYGPRKFKRCGRGYGCQMGRPPMSDVCQALYDDDGDAADITVTKDGNSCYNKRNGGNGWCFTDEEEVLLLIILTAI